MSSFRVDAEELVDYSVDLRDVSSRLDGITAQVRSATGRISRNPALNKLGYASMVRDVASNVESQAKYVARASATLEKVARSYASYEARVIRAPFGGGGSAGLVSDKFVIDPKDASNPFMDFLLGDAKLSGALLSGKLEGEGEFLGIGASGAVAGELFGGQLSLSPEAKWDFGKGDVYAGISGKAEGHVAQGSLEGDYGILHGDAKGKLVTGAVEGELGGSLFRDGHLDPSLYAKASAKASVASGEANARIGNEDYNVHAKAKGDLLTAHAEASAHVGKDGVGAKVEAGAYAAEGEISGGINLFGVKLDVSLKGKAGGAGVEAGFEAGNGAVSGDLGIGLGLGAGISFKADFSGVPKAIDNAVQWWNDLWK